MVGIALRLCVGVIFLTIVPAAPAVAHHVVWLDFSKFTLDLWSGAGGVNGHSPVTAADAAAVRALIVANIVEDYAPFDIHFTTFQPANGRYSHIRFLPKNDYDRSGEEYSGCSTPSCCTICTGHGSWNKGPVSLAVVYLNIIARKEELQDANATTARLANFIALTASHELGHLLGLKHRHGAGDSFANTGCSEAPCPTADQFLEWHIMAFTRHWRTPDDHPQITNEEAATRNFFFSVYSERRVLFSALQASNHWSSLGNVDGGAGRADLIYGRVRSPATVEWDVYLSTGTAFGGDPIWNSDTGDAGDIFLVGDLNGDKRADLVYGNIVSRTQVRWKVRLASGSAFGSSTTWKNDGGDVGDIFRLADVNGDGRADLVYGRPLAPKTITWWVRLSTGTSFGEASIWANDGGDEGDLFFLADVDEDGDADLVYSRTVSATQVRWFVQRSNGSNFGSRQIWGDAGNEGDLFYVGDADGDGDADLVYGRALSDRTVKWYFRPSNHDAFGALQVWGNDAGNAGDLFRLGDGDGDGRLDLFYGRPTGMTSLSEAPDLTKIQWYGRRSLGTSFGHVSTWRIDAGDEGGLFR
jgi:hypothetical protein